MRIRVDAPTRHLESSNLLNRHTAIYACSHPHSRTKALAHSRTRALTYAHAYAPTHPRTHAPTHPRIHALNREGDEIEHVELGDETMWQVKSVVREELDALKAIGDNGSQMNSDVNGSFLLGPANPSANFSTSGGPRNNRQPLSNFGPSSCTAVG